MEKKIEKILEDLYMIDDDLKKSEKELVAVVRKLLESRPEVEINKAFVDELKLELLKRADEIKSPAVEDKAVFLSFRNFSFMLAGAVVCAVLFISSDMLTQKEVVRDFDKSVLNIAAGEIEKLEDGAFGSFSKKEAQLMADDGAAMLAQEESAADEVAPMASMALESDMANAKVSGRGAGGETMLASPSKMIMPPRNSYDYVYSGDDLQLPEGKLAVYKRNKKDSLSKLLAAKLASGNLGLSDVSKLKNTLIPSLNISEDREFGYNFYFDFKGGSLSVNTNWEKWPNVYDICDRGDRDCIEYNRLQESDVPEDKTLVEIADKFLQEYGISKKDYAAPVVDSSWQENSRYNGSEKYIPERISVTYPLMIEGKKVYSEYGSVEGMVVNVDIRFKRVAGVYNIFEKSYSSSDYAVSDDQEKILEVLKRGGNNIYWKSEDGRTVEIEVGIPELALVKMWKQEFAGDKQVELFVPCFVFPVTGEPQDDYFRKENIVVPIIEELINEHDDEGDDFTIEPMPLLRGEVLEIEE